MNLDDSRSGHRSPAICFFFSRSRVNSANAKLVELACARVFSASNSEHALGCQIKVTGDWILLQPLSFWCGNFYSGCCVSWKNWISDKFVSKFIWDCGFIALSKKEFGIQKLFISNYNKNYWFNGKVVVQVGYHWKHFNQTNSLKYSLICNLINFIKFIYIRYVEKILLKQLQQNK